jgi:hypothetical protein
LCPFGCGWLVRDMGSALVDRPHIVRSSRRGTGGSGAVAPDPAGRLGQPFGGPR